MKRTIKFRGKLVNSTCWVEGDYYFNHETNEHRIITGVSNDELLDWNVQHDTLGQYVGIEDKNDKEIYEGDIVKCGVDSIALEVYYNDTMAMFQLDNENVNQFAYALSDFYELEVIGNIYDTPELLNIPTSQK